MSEQRKMYVMNPCPFCGGPPCLSVRRWGNENDYGYQAHVWCHDCGAKASEAEIYSWDVEDRVLVQIDAIENWNHRDEAASEFYEKDSATVFFDEQGNERNLAEELDAGASA